jgi:hypothetical protein
MTCMQEAFVCTKEINDYISLLNTARRHMQGAKIREAKIREVKLREAQESIIPETVETVETVETQSVDEPMSSVGDEVRTDDVDVEIKIDAVEGKCLT